MRKSVTFVGSFFGSPMTLHFIGSRLLQSRLPVLDPLDALRNLIAIQPWELDTEERKEEFRIEVGRVADAGQLEVALNWLCENELPGSWHLGYYVGENSSDRPPDWVPPVFFDCAQVNPNGLLGYLKGREQSGTPHVFDSVLGSEPGLALAPQLRISLTARGPGSPSAIQRVRELLAELPVASAAGPLFGWHHSIDTETVFEVINSFVNRVESQQDYTAAVSWTSMALYEKPPHLMNPRRR